MRVATRPRRIRASDWYKDDNYINGGVMRKALLDAGYAVLALDAATHGERSREIDYQHVNTFDDPKAPARRNFFTFAEISIQTVKDYRRALDSWPSAAKW